MPAENETPTKTLPPPWDRIFSLGSRTFVWLLLLAVLYILRPFLLLVFLTFVFAYIQAHGVDGLAHRVKSRIARVVIVGLVFLGTIVATVFSLAPQVGNQAKLFADNWDKYLVDADKEAHKFLQTNPSIAKLFGKGPAARRTENSGNGEAQPATQDAVPDPNTVEPLISDLVNELIGVDVDFDPEKAPDPKRVTQKRLGQLKDIGTDVLGYVSAFLASILFSFLIVLDLPKISKGISGLANTKIGFIYDEVAETVHTFGRVLGRALEAQLLIAAVNTILTAIGIWVLGLEHMVFLSAIVFLCSFLPVAGVFISSFPICLLSMQSGGFGMVVLAIGLILLIHAIETYILNPRIYGHHMRMNPVLVLIVLTVSGKLAGIWGLLLGIPLVNYIFRHAIRYPKDQPAVNDV